MIFFVIMCSDLWFVFDNYEEATNIYDSHPGYVEKGNCQRPATATENDIAFYKSKDFHSNLTRNIPNQLEKNYVIGHSIEFTYTGEPSEVTNIEPYEAENDDDSTDSIVSTSDEGKIESSNCIYWLDQIETHLYKLNRKCEK